MLISGFLAQTCFSSRFFQSLAQNYDDNSNNNYKDFSRIFATLILLFSS